MLLHWCCGTEFDVLPMKMYRALAVISEWGCAPCPAGLSADVLLAFLRWQGEAVVR